MNIEWKYDLPTDEKSDDYQYECPIFYKDGHIYFILDKNKKTDLHIIDTQTGIAHITPIPCSYCNIPSRCFFLDYQDKILIYTGDLWVYKNQTLSKFLTLSDCSNQIFSSLLINTNNRINSYVLHQNRFIFTNSYCLYCCNLDTLSLEWKLDISNKAPYSSGPLSIFENKIACYGNDRLLFVDIEQGTVIDQIKLPRVSKIFSPIRIDEENLLLGYTNWSNAGILKYNTATSKVVWKHKRCFEGPQDKCKIYKIDNFAYWVKNGTELICVNVESGEEEYRVRTDPWLYTDLIFKEHSILFGTSGRDGYLKNLDAKSGKENWSVFLKNGCAYFDFYKNTILVGDFEHNVYQIDVATGNKLQTLDVGGEVVGDIKVYGDHAYTVVWGNENEDIKLIKIKI